MFRYKKFRKPKYTGDSIVDGLKQSVYGKRSRWPSNEKLFHDVGTLEEIAYANRLSYFCPRTAHIAMLELLKRGELLQPAAITRLL